MRGILRRWLLQRRKTTSWEDFKRRHGWQPGFQETTWETIRRDTDGRITIGATLLYDRKTAHITCVIPDREETVADDYWSYADINEEKTIKVEVLGRDAYATEPMKIR